MIIHDCEQGTEEWRLLRAGMPTASEFSSIITSKGEPSKSMKKYAMTLAAELYAKKPLEVFAGNYHTDRGTELEPQARAEYEFIIGHYVEQIGFVTDDKNKYGCSPDGLVGEDGMTEYKCLKTDNHVSAMLFYKKYGRCPAEYVQQTQGQLFVCDRKWCDLVFYHPDLPMVVIKQTVDIDFQKALVKQLNAVISERDSILETINSY